MQAPTNTIIIDGTQVAGRSRAGEATSFTLPKLKWVFDCGALCHRWKPKAIFLSHTHSDHVHFLPMLRNEDNPPTIYLLEEALPFVKNFLMSYQQMVDMEMQEPGAELVGYNLVPIRPDEDVPVDEQNYRVRTIRMTHRIPCLGFSVFQTANQLKKEYIGETGAELGQLKKRGVDVHEKVEEPYLCFMGDTTCEVFREYRDILKHKIIIVECSFIDEETVARAKETMHMHWFDLEEVIKANPQTMFLLTHFSLRYSALKLRNFFCKHQRKYSNIHPMLDQNEVVDQVRRSREKNPGQNGREFIPRCLCRICKTDNHHQHNNNNSNNNKQNHHHRNHNRSGR